MDFADDERDLTTVSLLSASSFSNMPTLPVLHNTGRMCYVRGDTHTYAHAHTQR